MRKVQHCPSAQPEWKGSFVFGIVQGTPDAPSVDYLGREVRVTETLLKAVEPVSPTEVFRFAAPCVTGACQHFQGGTCRLAAKTVEHLAAVTAALPACGIRDVCRWYSQEGAGACFRCPQVVTDLPSKDPVLRVITDPG